MSGRTTTPNSSKRPVAVLNLADEDAPAFGCYEVAGVDIVNGQTRYRIQKPTGSGVKFLLGTGVKVPSGKTGGAYLPRLGDDHYALFEAASSGSSDQPAFGDTWGPVEDSWKLQAGGSGWRVLGNLVDDVQGVRMLVELLAASSSFSAAKTTSTVTARSGTTVGEGTADFYSVVDGELTEGEEVDVINAFASSIVSGSWIQIALDREGNWQVVSVECVV